MNCLLVSALHLFLSLVEKGEEKKVGGLKGVGYFGLLGVTLCISVAVGVLKDCAVGMCLVGEKKLRQRC